MSREESVAERASSSDSQIEVLYLDESLVAVDKPAGLAVHRGWDREPRAALQVVRDQIGRWLYPVHRLDRPTSGVLVFALEQQAARSLTNSWAAGRVEKSYLGLVRGIAPDEAVIDHPLRRHGSTDERQSACTHIRRLAVFERYSLVEAQPQSGRLHQIRRHLKHLSLPLIGDVRYGKGEHNRLFRHRFGLHRLALHAFRLRLPHPLHGEPLWLQAPLPADLAVPLAAMGLLAAAEEVLKADLGGV